MKKDKQKEEIAQLKKELKQIKKEKESLSQKLTVANKKTSDLQKELKKNDAKTITLSTEQIESLSNQLKDIDILNSLLD